MTNYWPIYAGNGRVWTKLKQLDPAQGLWIEMPASYDPAIITEEDLEYDNQLRRLTDEEVERAERGRSVGDDGRVLCGDWLRRDARRLCGDCANGWGPGEEEPPGCGTLLELLAAE